MPKVVDKQKKSEAISRAALSIFRRLGYHQSKMADIARAAGVGKGTLYEYFDNKADILGFAFERYFAAFEAGALEAMKEKRSPAAKLLALVGFALDHVAEWEDHCMVYVDYLGVERSTREEVSLRDIYGKMRNVLLELVRQGQAVGEFRRDIDPEGAAELLLSVYDGIVLHRIFEERRCNIASLRTATLALVERGLGPEGGLAAEDGEGCGR